jgi:hypothetical protein
MYANVENQEMGGACLRRIFINLYERMILPNEQMHMYTCR